MVAGKEMRKDDDIHGHVQISSMISKIVLVLDFLFEVWDDFIGVLKDFNGVLDSFKGVLKDSFRRVLDGILGVLILSILSEISNI